MRYLRLFGEALSSAFGALRVNKLRTFLSLIGITIGISAIIGVFTITDSMEKKIKDSLSEFGDNVIFIQKWPWTFGEDYPWWKYYARPEPTAREYQTLAARLEGSSVVSQFAYEGQLGSQRIKSGKISVNEVSVHAVTHSYAAIQPVKIEEGRFFTPKEASSGAPLALVGYELEAELLGGNGLGKSITWQGRQLLVIGVLEKEGNNALGGTADKKIFVNMAYARKANNVESDQWGPTILVAGPAGVDVEETKAEIRGAYRAIRRLKPGQDDSFALNQISLLSSALDSLFGVISLIGWIIGGFSILVGGFGIANIMFVSVKERTSQIGIQKALGARNSFILQAFLTESVALAVMGGILGLFIVFGLTLIVNAVSDIGIFLSLRNILIGLTTSAIIGIVSGLIPAIGASRMNPVDAIRYA
jgi:putative ABC transport system permease protein